MAILNTLIASSAVALTILAQTAAPVNALAAGAHGLAARHVGVTPNHAGMLKRKRNTHKNRKRCVAQQSQATSTSVDAPSSTPDTSSNNNNNNSNNNNSGSNNNGGYTGSSAPACSSGGKVGLAWAPDLSSNYIPSATTGRTCYLYNWSSWAPDSSLLGGLKFIPMFWGNGHFQDFTDNVINSGTNYGIAAAMNEVNQDGQANIDVGTGLAWWREYLLPLRRDKGYYIISPSTTNAPSGLEWMNSWYSQLDASEKPDGIAIHIYSPTYQSFVDYLGQVKAAFPGKDIWITEFACTDFSYQTSCDVGAVAPQLAQLFDNDPNVKAYFPFGWVGSMQGVQEDNRLMIDHGNWGEVTAIGHDYIG